MVCQLCAPVCMDSLRYDLNHFVCMTTCMHAPKPLQPTFSGNTNHFWRSFIIISPLHQCFQGLIRQFCLGWWPFYEKWYAPFQCPNGGKDESFGSGAGFYSVPLPRDLQSGWWKCSWLTWFIVCNLPAGTGHCMTLSPYAAWFSLRTPCCKFLPTSDLWQTHWLVMHLTESHAAFCLQTINLVPHVLNTFTVPEICWKILNKLEVL